MTSETIDFFFAYLSPYSYLANERIEQVASAYQVKLRYKPIGHTTSNDGPKINPMRYDYIVEEDVPRYAREMELEYYSRPPLTESHTASRGFLYAQDQGKGIAFNKKVFSARWGEGKDISNLDILAEIASGVGLNREEFLEALDNSSYKNQLADVLVEAGKVGVFGAPTFIYNGKRFWGNDRIDQLVKELAKTR